MTVSVGHVDVDEKGVARIAGTRMRVSHLAIDTQLGLSPAQIREQYPHLSLAQIHASLAYYYDHQKDIDAQIQREYEFAEDLRRTMGNPVTREELLRRRQEAFRAKPT